MTKIKFEFKPFPTPSDIPRPVIRATFFNGNLTTNQIAIIDSGADFCFVPISYGKIDLKINFDKIAPRVTRDRWKNIDKGGKEYEEFIQELYNSKLVIPDEFGCACGRNNIKGFFAPVHLKIENIKLFVMVFFCKNESHTLIGRIGIFDRFKYVIFDKKNFKGYFEI